VASFRFPVIVIALVSPEQTVVGDADKVGILGKLQDMLQLQFAIHPDFTVELSEVNLIVKLPPEEVIFGGVLVLV
jgi:hypothetical protein